MYESRDVLISRILTTAPNQLPPIVHLDGCFSLDLVYLGKPYHKIGLSLEEVLQGYYEFVTKTNYWNFRNEDARRDLPVPLGASIQGNGK